MAEISQEERDKIYQEERARQEAREDMVQEAPPKNKKAKDGIVLALGSLIVGYLFGIPAIVYGIQGISHAKKYPKAGGKGLSMFNLILGCITTTFYIWLTLHRIRSINRIFH